MFDQSYFTKVLAGMRVTVSLAGKHGIKRNASRI